MPWKTLTAGIAIGVLATYLALHWSAPEPATTATPESGAATGENSETAGERPHFTYYTVLPESEVIVPDAPEARPHSAPEPLAGVAAEKSPPPPARATVTTTAPRPPSTPEQPAPRATPTPPRPTADPGKPPRLLLQAGSFKSAAEAHSRRSKLVQLGLPTSVQPVNPRPGETWYRVLVGPLEPGRSLADARATMLEHGIDHVVLQRRD